MCTIVRRFGLIHICSSDSRVSSSACDSIEHDSDHDTWMVDKTDRSVLFDETEFAFIRQWCCDIVNQSIHHSDQIFVLTEAPMPASQKYRLSQCQSKNKCN